MTWQVQLCGNRRFKLDVGYVGAIRIYTNNGRTVIRIDRCFNAADLIVSTRIDEAQGIIADVTVEIQRLRTQGASWRAVGAALGVSAATALHASGKGRLKIPLNPEAVSDSV